MIHTRKTKNVLMTRHAWRSFRNWVGLKRLESLDLEGHDPDYINFVYVLTPKLHYPRIHFKCKYTKTHANIEFHIDLSRHNSIGQSYELNEWQKVMNEFTEIYPKLVKLKRMALI